MISTESDYPGAPDSKFHAGDQLDWLKQDLAEANKNRDKVPFIVVLGHRPLYTASPGRYYQNGSMVPGTPNAVLIQNFEKLFLQNKVDIYYSGHVHLYERHYPTAEGRVDLQNGVTYVIQGNA